MQQLARGPEADAELEATAAGASASASASAFAFDAQQLALDSLDALKVSGQWDDRDLLWRREFVVAGRTLRLLEDVPEDGSDGELAIWAAGLVLARYLESAHADSLRRAALVVELGAGAACPALAAAALGARRVVATEQEKALLALLCNKLGNDLWNTRLS